MNYKAVIFDMDGVIFNPVHSDFKNADTTYSEPGASSRPLYHLIFEVTRKAFLSVFKA